MTVVRAEMTAAIALLAWLRSRHHDLGTTRQADLDDWLADGPAGPRNASPFIAWAVRRGHARDVAIPLRTAGRSSRKLIAAGPLCAGCCTTSNYSRSTALPDCSCCSTQPRSCIVALTLATSTPTPAGPTCV